jgi:hypothetical protein
VSRHGCQQPREQSEGKKNGAAVKWSSRSWHRSSAWRKEPRGRREADHGRRSCCSCGKGQREEGDRLEQHAMGVAAGRWRHGQGAPASMGKKVLLHCALTRACSRKGRRGGAMGEARLSDGCCCREEEAGRERVAAGKNGGVGVKNCQVSTPIYRRSPRVRVSLVGQMGWVGLAQTRYRAALNIFRNKMLLRNSFLRRIDRIDFGRSGD